MQTTTISQPTGLPEQRIIKACIESREAYEQLRRIGISDDGFTAIGRRALGDIRRYYELDNDARSVDVESLFARADTLPNPKHAGAIKDYLRTLPDGVSARNVVSDLTEHRKRLVGGRLSIALANNSPEVPSLIAEYQAIEEPTGETEEVLIDPFDVSDLEQEAGEEEQRIALWPRALSDRCNGGAKRGHHLLVYGRPESGKTLVTLNMVVGFLHQGLKVLYVGNEEPISDLRQRIRQRVTGRNVADFTGDRAGSAKSLREQKASGKITGQISFADLSPGTFPVIDRLCGKHKPDVLVLDQLRNIRVAAEARVEELESAATQARNLAKRHGLLVVSVTQAGASADGKIYLDLSDVDSSKTGIPAQVDLMVGVGSNEAMRAAGVLGFSLPKNKISGDHAQFTVEYKIETGAISNRQQ